MSNNTSHPQAKRARVDNPSSSIDERDHSLAEVITSTSGILSSSLSQYPIGEKKEEDKISHLKDSVENLKVKKREAISRGLLCIQNALDGYTNQEKIGILKAYGALINVSIQPLKPFVQALPAKASKVKPKAVANKQQPRASWRDNPEYLSLMQQRTGLVNRLKQLSVESEKTSVKSAITDLEAKMKIVKKGGSLHNNQQ